MHMCVCRRLQSHGRISSLCVCACGLFVYEPSVNVYNDFGSGEAVLLGEAMATNTCVLYR